MEMEGVIAGSPRDVAVRFTSLLLTRLAVNTDLHEMVPANGTVILLALPLPHGHSVPFCNDELLLPGRGIDLHVAHFRFNQL